MDSTSQAGHSTSSHVASVSLVCSIAPEGAIERLALVGRSRTQADVWEWRLPPSSTGYRLSELTEAVRLFLLITDGNASDVDVSSTSSTTDRAPA